MAASFCSHAGWDDAPREAGREWRVMRADDHCTTCRVKHDVIIAFKVCDSCICSYPAVHQLCQRCHGAPRAVEHAVDYAASRKGQPTLPIESVMTVERLIDELTLHLAAVVEEIHVENDRVSKYYAQARALMHRIPIARPTPVFIISKADPTDGLVLELENCKNEDTLGYVLRSAVGRLFENLNYNYFHLSVARSLVVRLEK
jgi:hypothetical protein